VSLGTDLSVSLSNFTSSGLSWHLF
jgi:hypothetical protein